VKIFIIRDTKRVTSILLISAKENRLKINNERELNEQTSRRYVGADLDIPGSELDDKQ
jgi:hypothetical protein